MCCTCPDWIRYSLPCKHIFSATGQDFGALPEEYRQCIEFNSSDQLSTSYPGTRYAVVNYINRLQTTQQEHVQLEEPLTHSIEDEDEGGVAPSEEELDSPTVTDAVPTDTEVQCLTSSEIPTSAEVAQYFFIRNLDSGIICIPFYYVPCVDFKLHRLYIIIQPSPPR